MPMNPRLLRPLATGFNPRSIAGLEAWYAADVASSITIETGVSQWNDLSGKGRDLVQTVTNDQPAYNSVTLNGKPTVTFDGANDFLRTAAFTLNQPFAYFLVFRFEASANGARILDAGTQGIARSGEFFRLSDTQIQIFSGASGGAVNAGQTAIESFNIWDIEFNGASSVTRYRKNVNTATGNAGSNNGTRLTMGAGGNNASPGSFAPISMAEALVFLRVLTEAEGDKIRRYLGKKYNLPFQA